ncbi:MAG: DUF5114 domain-containing protein [Mangrovibacterium sp.]
MKRNIVLIFFALLTLVSCVNDGELLTLSSVSENELIASGDNVVLTTENNTSAVLSFAWNVSKLVGSSPEVLAGEPTTTLEISSDETFETDVVRVSVSNNSKAFTGGELNSILNSIEMVNGFGRFSMVNFRLAAASGSNITPLYSETISLRLSPYKIDFTRGDIVVANAESGNMESTSVWLYSPEENGVYSGFMGVSAWYNCFLQEGNGTVWGNDGVTGTAFQMSSSTVDGEKWNFWFPNASGSFYVVFDTNKKEWTANHISTMTVSGDLAGEMFFTKDDNTWTLAGVEVESGTTYSLTLKGETTIFNQTSGNSESSNFGNIFFAQEGDAIVKASAESTIEITATQSGKLAIVLDLNAPDALTISFAEGVEVPVAYPEQIYVMGIDDDWTDWTNTLAQGEEGQYAGTITVTNAASSSIKFYTESGNWDTGYGVWQEGGTMGLGWSDGIVPSEEGDYKITVNLIENTFTFEKIAEGGIYPSEIYLMGIDGDWGNWTTTLAETSSDGVYAGTITVTNAASSSIKFYTESGNWDTGYGVWQEGGTMGLDWSDGIVPSAAGSYAITVNLNDNTFTFTAQ